VCIADQLAVRLTRGGTGATGAATRRTCTSGLELAAAWSRRGSQPSSSPSRPTSRKVSGAEQPVAAKPRGRGRCSGGRPPMTSTSATSPPSGWSSVRASSHPVASGSTVVRCASLPGWVPLGQGPDPTAAGAVKRDVEAEARAMKIKHRIMLWYAKRRARKQAEHSRDQVASAPRTAGSAAASGTRSAGAATARSARSAGPATKLTGGHAAKSAGASMRKGSSVAKRADRRPSGRSSNSD
jgi:hypothetical protein